MLQYILMVAGFAFVIKGADYLIKGASALAKKLKVSDLAIGLTVVAFGTSLPELFVNIIASAKGNAGIAIGNILGSNIANILLILGVSAIIFPLTVTRGTVWKEIPLSLLAALLVGIMANDQLIDGGSLSCLTRIDGLVLLCFFVIFIFYSAGIAGKVKGLDEQVPEQSHGSAKIFLFIILGFFALFLGGKWLVDGAVKMAASFGVSESVIGLTIVAVGTSLPELATSAVAAYRKKPEIAIGNVVGSNIFNIFFILGVSSVIKPLPFPAKSNVDIGVLIVVSLLLFIFMFTGKKRMLDRWEAVLFLMMYAGYICIVLIN